MVAFGQPQYSEQLSFVMPEPSSRQQPRPERDRSLGCRVILARVRVPPDSLS